MIRNFLAACVSLAVAGVLASSSILLTAFSDLQTPVELGATHSFTVNGAAPDTVLVDQEAVQILANSADSAGFQLYRLAGELSNDEGRHLLIPVNAADFHVGAIQRFDQSKSEVVDPHQMQDLDFTGQYVAAPLGDASDVNNFLETIRDQGVEVSESSGRWAQAQFLLLRLPTVIVAWLLLILSLATLVVSLVILGKRRYALEKLNGYSGANSLWSSRALLFLLVLFAGGCFGTVYLIGSGRTVFVPTFLQFYGVLAGAVFASALLGFLLTKRVRRNAVADLAGRKTGQRSANRLISIGAVASIFLLSCAGVLTVLGAIDQRESIAGDRIWERLSGSGKIYMKADEGGYSSDAYDSVFEDPAFASRIKDLVDSFSGQRQMYLSHTLPPEGWVMDYFELPEALPVVLATKNWREVAGYSDADFVGLTLGEEAALQDHINAGSEIWAEPAHVEQLRQSMSYYKVHVDKPVGVISGTLSEEIFTPRDFYLIEVENLDSFDGFFLMATMSSGNLLLEDFDSLHTALVGADLNHHLRAVRADDQGLERLLTHSSAQTIISFSLIVAFATAVLSLLALMRAALQSQSRLIFNLYTNGVAPLTIASKILIAPIISFSIAICICLVLLANTRDYYFLALAIALAVMQLLFIREAVGKVRSTAQATARRGK